MDVPIGVQAFSQQESKLYPLAVQRIALLTQLVGGTMGEGSLSTAGEGLAGNTMVALVLLAVADSADVRESSSIRVVEEGFGVDRTVEVLVAGRSSPTLTCTGVLLGTIAGSEVLLPPELTEPLLVTVSILVSS